MRRMLKGGWCGLALLLWAGGAQAAGERQIWAATADPMVWLDVGNTVSDNGIIYYALARGKAPGVPPDGDGAIDGETINRDYAIECSTGNSYEFGDDGLSLLTLPDGGAD